MPWGSYCTTSPLGPEHFRSGANSDVIGKIARFAVQFGVDVVLAPTHFLADPLFKNWFTVDRDACVALRRALDREGGAAVAMDYPLLHAHVALENVDTRRQLLAGLKDLPFDHLWVRASGLETHAGPLTVRRFLSAMSDLRDLGQPIILDYLGGLLGSAAIAFGVASGKAHGIGERERFDAREWHKLPRDKDPEQKYGRTQRIAVPGLGRSVTTSELEVLASARGGKRLVVCGDRNCCSHGLSDMLADPRRHVIHQTFQEIDALSSVPESYREQHFLDQTLNATVRRAREIKRLKPTAESATRHRVNIDSLMQRLRDYASSVEKVQRVLERLHENKEDGAPRVRPVASVRTRQHNTLRNERS